jgi:ParB family chromosome partitioning protein
VKSQRGGLGRGLDALIPRGDRGTLQIEIDAITPNPHQPRDHFDPAALEELAASIREHGILQPLIVSQHEGAYTLIAGERRWRASRLAGLTMVPVVVKEVSPRQQLEWALVENIQRQDLNPIEAAGAYQQLIHEHGLTQDEVATRVGKNRSTIANTLRLLRLPAVVIESLTAGEVSEGHARALLLTPEPADQVALHQVVVREGLSVRQTEQRARRITNSETRPAFETPASHPFDADVEALEGKLRDTLGTKVELRYQRGAGRVVIHYYSDEELDALMSRLIPDQG